MNFTYQMPTKVYFGEGSVEEIKDIDCEHTLLVTGSSAMKRTGILDKVVDLLPGEVEVFDKVESDPSVETVDEIAANCTGKDAVVGLGGGSALDAAKAAVVVQSSGANAADVLWGKAKPVKQCLPVYAIPTTSGTASEVTEISVLSDKDTKKSFRNQNMYPKCSYVDPLLTHTCPKDVTASSGLDALAHAVEAYVSTRSQPLTDELCMGAAKLASENILAAYENADDADARNNMMLASLMAGFGITNCGAGLAHSLSYSLWRIAKTPHGLACGILLPHVMRYNLGCEGGNYAALAKRIGFKNAEDLISRVEELNKAMDVPARLGELEIKEGDIPEMVDAAMGGSVKVNPRTVDEKAMAKFIEEII